MRDRLVGHPCPITSLQGTAEKASLKTNCRYNRATINRS